jgi:hypothetical protein
MGGQHRHRDWTITRGTWAGIAVVCVLAWSGILTAAWLATAAAVKGVGL